MAEQQNNPEGIGSTNQMATKAELEGVTKRLDAMFTLMMNSPLFKTPPEANSRAAVISLNVNPERPTSPAASHVGPPPSARAEGSKKEKQSRGHEKAETKQGTVRIERPVELISQNDSEDTADTGVSKAAKKRKVETGNP